MPSFAPGLALLLALASLPSFAPGLALLLALASSPSFAASFGHHHGKCLALLLALAITMVSA